MAMKDIASGRSDLYRIDPTKIQVKDDWNSRDTSDPANEDHIRTLMGSIREIGVKKPLVAYMDKDVAYVTDGHCRLEAVKRLIADGVEIKTVPVIVEDKFSSEADRIFTQIVHNQGKPLTSLEQAKVFKRLLDLGWSQKDIASKAGLSGGRISQVLYLLTLPMVIQKFVVEGRASENMVVSTYKKHNEDVAATVAELSGAVANAEKEGRKKAKPSDAGEGEGDGEGKPKPSAKAGNGKLASYLKKLVEKSYVDSLIDDTEGMVTWSLREVDWAELMEMIDY